MKRGADSPAKKAATCGRFFSYIRSFFPMQEECGDLDGVEGYLDTHSNEIKVFDRADGELTHQANTPPIDVSSQISKLPIDILALIFNKTPESGAAISPALRAVNHTFKRGYYHALKIRLNINESAFKKQQEEINYLLQNKSSILDRGCYELKQCFNQLEAINQKSVVDPVIAFQVREEALNQLNAKIICGKIDHATPESLDCTRCHLTRFPGRLFTAPAYRHHRDFWTKLKVLRISQNQLTSLPAEIGCLAALDNLTLHHNKVTVLPVEIGQLKLLQVLNLGHNQLTAVSEEIIQKLGSLRVLNIISNKISKIPSNLKEEILHTYDEVYLDFKVFALNDRNITIANMLETQISMQAGQEPSQNSGAIGKMSQIFGIQYMKKF